MNEITYTVAPFDLTQISPVHARGIFGDFGDVLRAEIDSLRDERSRGLVERRRFYEFLLQEVDAERFRRIQREFVTPEHEAAEGGGLKYLDPLHWFKAKLNLALKMGLDRLPPSDILDIGAGCGHFPTVARFYGHEVLAIDRPLEPEVADQSTHLYDAMCDVYGVTKREYRIEPFRAFEFERRFDVVTAFMTTFNLMEDGRPYPLEAWRFFFENLRERVLKPSGFVFLQLNQGTVTDEVWQFLASAAEWSVPSSMVLLIRDLQAVCGV